MKRNRDIRILSVAMVLSLIALVACNSNECFENKNSLPYAGFYSSESVPQKISIDSISVYGLEAPDKSMVLDSVTGVSSVYLPFNIDVPYTSFVFDYLQKSIEDDRLNDTITFRYDILPFFVSSECGVIYKYKINEIITTKHLIDSVTCPLTTIDNVDSENLRIYFRVATE